MLGVDFIYNGFLPTNKKMQIILSKVITTYTRCVFTHSNSFANYIHTFFRLQLLFPYFPDFILSLIIKKL
jgi:hypothetical protein